MKTRVMTQLVWILAVLMITGCIWVKPEHGTIHVQVLSHAQAAQCKQLGRTTVSVLSSIAFIPRSEEQVRAELETLARNSAVEIDGDSIVAISKIIEGEQVYNIYRCKVKHAR